MLHITAIGASVRKGKATAATLEAMELSGSHFYNANWGYQNGEKRNAGISHNFQPLFTLNYDCTPDNRTRLELAAAYQFGFNGNSALDWYNARDPRPDFYRNMPSFYETDSAILNIAAANEVRNKWMTDETVRQINWNRLYETNTANIQTVNGETGKRSLYIVGESLNEIRKFSLSGTLNKVMNENISFSGGAFFASQLTERYKRISDLLGGDFYVNLNQYAERTYMGNSIFIQNDLNNPDGIIKEGGKYGYDYKIKFMKSFIWGQVMFDYKKVDFFGTARLGMDAFIREGLFKNGLFAEDSYGSSANHRFLNYQIKGGVTYKIDGRNYLFVNAAIMTSPPLFNNTFISPATRNLALERPRMEQIKSIEGGYLLCAPGFSGKLAAFVSEINDATRIRRFYHEDYLAFVNYLMRNLNVRHIGAELSIQAKITSSLSATAVASWKQVFNTSDAAISIYRDNDTTTFVPQSVSYLKNTFVATGPQTACMLGLDYRMPGYWHVGANFNYLTRNYVDINPVRYTAEVLETIPKGSSQWHAIVDQEKLPPAFTVDLSVGKSFLLSKAVKRLPYGTSLIVNLTITNLLNNKDIQIGGYEQSRFDLATFNPDKFPSKYYYNYGVGYFLNLSLKF